MKTPRSLVHVIDDEPGVRKAVARLLTVEGFEVRVYASAEEFFTGYCADEGGCLVLDVAMPNLGGLEVQRRLAEIGLLVPIVFVTGHGDIPMSVRAIKAGAIDFLTKPVNDIDLLRAVRAASALASRRAVEHSAFATLTPREREVMGHVVAGKLNKQIAAELGTGEQNIKIHRGRVMEKMGAESLADLVRISERLLANPRGGLTKV